ncbi:MAG: phospho-sugar mutase [Candidatus Izemoplasma sp.]
MANIEYKKWLDFKGLDSELSNELKAMDSAEIEEAFYKSLEFGTGGLRGIIGAGINRMNVYTIRKANYGFAKYLLKYHPDALERGIVIAHDNRNKSVEFSKASASVFASFGIKTYLFDSLRPTPELSFAVRHLNAVGGIVVTASHNPPKYNGYKIYDEDGCQLVPRLADEVVEFVNSASDVFKIESMDFDDALKAGLVEYIGKEIDDLYLDAVDTVQLDKDVQKVIKIIFTPLHGTSYKIGVETLERNGYNVIPVVEQLVNDPFFGTVKSPNPENKEAFDMAIEYGNRFNADILIATDPDADRLGVAVKHDGEYILLTGNQTGAILVDYILKTRKEQGTLPKKGMVYNTVVTSEFGAVIAKSYGMEVMSTLTGFKFIGEQAKVIEDTEYEFMFGYEESYGYVIKDFVRDKDSIQALLLISEIANKLLLEGKTLYDYLLDLYHVNGTFREDLVNIQLEGIAGEQRIKTIMDYFRVAKIENVLGVPIIVKEDYLLSERITNETTKIELPKSNVIKYILEDKSWFVLRPSGTEPKLKIYVGVVDSSIEVADLKIEKIVSEVLTIIDNI